MAGNAVISGYLMAKFILPRDKIVGLEEAYQLGRGEGVTEPRDIEIYRLPPSTPRSKLKSSRLWNRFWKIGTMFLKKLHSNYCLFNTIKANLNKL